MEITGLMPGFLLSDKLHEQRTMLSCPFEICSAPITHINKYVLNGEEHQENITLLSRIHAMHVQETFCIYNQVLYILNIIL